MNWLIRENFKKQQRYVRHIYDATGDVMQAEKLFRKTLYLDPCHEEALFFLSLFAEQKGKVNEAKNLKQRIARLKNNTTQLS